MFTSIWYHDGDKRPSKSGYYLAYKMSTLGDDSEGFESFYWDHDRTVWREFKAPHASAIRVSIWTTCPEHDPDYDNYNEPTVAEIDAWKNVEDAISKFNMVKELSR